MGTLNWIGLASPVAQVATATFSTYNVGTTRKIAIGGVTVQAADSGGTLTAALTALAVLLNASTSPYFNQITWSSNATQIIGTSDVAGMQFVFVGSDTAGTCTSAFLCNGTGGTVVNAGPNDWASGGNWDTGVAPANGDDVFIGGNSSSKICWNLAQSGVTLNSLNISKTFTGSIGLDSSVLATSADGQTTVATAVEYRQTYLQISATASTGGFKISTVADIIGGTSGANGSKRIMIDIGTVASQSVEILSSASAASENGKAAIRLKGNSNTSDIYVRSAPGGVGLALDKPGETSTFRNVYVTDTSTSTNVLTGPGVTLTLWEQTGGQNVLQSSATCPTINVKGGSLVVEGNFTITAANVYSGGSFYPNNYGSPCITGLNLYGGTTDFTKSSRARTVTNTTYQKESNSTLKYDGSVITLTNLAGPATRVTLTAS